MEELPAPTLEERPMAFEHETCSQQIRAAIAKL